MSYKQKLYFARFCKYLSLLIVLAGMFLASPEKVHKPKDVLFCAVMGTIIALCGAGLTWTFNSIEKWYIGNKMLVKVK